MSTFPDFGDLQLHPMPDDFRLPNPNDPLDLARVYPPIDPVYTFGIVPSPNRDPTRDVGAAAAQVDGEQKRLDVLREQSPVQPVRQPQNVANGAVAIPATAQVTPTPLVLVGGSLQMGVIRHLMLNVSGLLSTTAGNPITIQLANSYGQIYFSTVLVTTTGAVALPAVWDFADIYVPFTQGLALSILVGSGSVGNAGEVSVNVIWEA